MGSLNIRFCLLNLLLFLSAIASAQQLSLADFSNEQLGSIYYAYPQPSGKETTVPKGFEAFYISHFGRHGSRWITSDDRYTKVINEFEINALTPLGEDVKQRLNKVWEDAQGRSGDLTRLGELQHKEIAERMYNRYPKVFQGNAVISARANIVVRCIMSMAAFCERLKELNPALKIEKEANQRYTNYLAYTTPEAEKFLSEESEWRKDFERFEAEHIKSQRLIASLFKYPEKIKNPHELMMGLYWIASDMQNVDISVSFYDIFEKQELFGIWQSINYRMYICNAASPINKGIMPLSAKSLLVNIIESADQAIKQQKPTATLRFGNDTYFIRLLALMQIEGCHNIENDPNKYFEAWQDFRVSPMAANLQIVFYKNKNNDILVKFFHNENETRLPLASASAPYYRWEDVKLFYNNLYNLP